MNFPTNIAIQMAFLLFLQLMNLSHCVNTPLTPVTVITCNLRCISSIVTVIGAFVTLTCITLGCVGYFCKRRALQNAIRARANNQGRIVRVRVVANRNTPNPTTNIVSTVVANPVVAPQSNQPTVSNNNITNSDTLPPVIPGYTYTIPKHDVAVSDTVLHPPTENAPK